VNRAALLLASGLLLLGAARAQGAGLNVSPVQLYLKAEESKALLTLRNDGGEAARFQLQVHAWGEDPNTGMTLGPTEDIVFYPTLITLKPGETHKVRIGTTVTFGGLERTYRLFVEELPPTEKPAQSRSAVRVLTRVGIPIFLQPTKVLESQTLSPVALSSGAAAFDLQNAGNVHLRVETVRLEGFAPGGARLFEREAPGWYVLAGTRKHFSVDVPRDACARVRKLIATVKTDRDQTLQQELETPGGACGS
jgi:fimbrial chaperone protein